MTQNHYAFLKHTKVSVSFSVASVFGNLLHFDSLNIVTPHLFVIAHPSWAVTIIFQPFQMSSYLHYEMKNNSKYAWYFLKD